MDGWGVLCLLPGGRGACWFSPIILEIPWAPLSFIIRGLFFTPWLHSSWIDLRADGMGVWIDWSRLVIFASLELIWILSIWIKVSYFFARSTKDLGSMDDNSDDSDLSCFQ